jgi:predicted protein tyrosine phosphatase
MIKKVYFIPQMNAERIIPDENMVIISVTNPGEFARLHKDWKEILRLEFDDIDNLHSYRIRFNYDHAREILKFLSRNENVEEIFVHCLAGISRSSAIAKFIAEKYNINEFLRRYENYDLYNKWVYRTLKETDNPDYLRYD